MRSTPVSARRILIALAAAALSGSASAQLLQGPMPPPQNQAEFWRGEILVQWKTGVPKAVSEGIHADLGSTILEYSERGNFERVSIAAGMDEQEIIDAYSALPLIEYAELNSVCRAHGVPNDPFYGFQWHMPQIDMETAWDTATGSGVVVAILDSGIAYENYTIPSWESNTVASGVTQYIQASDLASTSFVPGYDFINNDSHPNDNNAHGTHVAGTVAQSTNNNLGVAGVAYNASLMPVKVLNYQGSGSASALANGLYYAADNGADVVNMSLGWSPGYNPGSTVANAVAYAYNAGVTLVASSGNAGTGTVSYPAAYSQVIAVGAVRYDENLSYYSQWGSAQEVVAPGGDVTIDQNGDGYVDGVLQQTMVGYSSESSKANPTSMSYYFYQGTSMASPHVAGVVALMISNGITGVENIRSTLASTATDLGASGYDTIFGHGLINAAAAIGGGGGPGEDNEAPNPDPMSFSTPPTATGTSSITMTATTATDDNDVEYSFTATDGGNDSGWQDSPTYTDTGLAADTTYSYYVTARDKSSNQNATAPSGTASATTDPDGGGGGPTILTYDDFESGWGNFSDGGRDARRYTGGTYAAQGNAALNIQDNSGSQSSVFYTNTVDVAGPGYTQLTVEFSFIAISMENGEDFFVEYYDGSSWQIVAAFARGADFNNNTFYDVTVTIDESSHTFPSNASIRFRCDASGNRDDIYIDDVTVSAE